MDDSDLRFGGIQRLYSEAGWQRLRQARVCVIGVGGVGSWTVEALARSGVGSLTLADLDDVCVSNINRQLQALDTTVGRPKVEVMAERIRAINPSCRVTAIPEFFTAESAAGILGNGFDYIVDAIDDTAHKCLLIARCRERGVRVVTVGGAGGRRDALGGRVADLAETTHNGLLQAVRKRLRDEYGFPRGPKEKFQVPCVFLPTPARRPFRDEAECAAAEGGSLRLDCESGYGTASFVTGALGLLAAGHVVNEIAKIGP